MIPPNTAPLNVIAPFNTKSSTLLHVIASVIPFVDIAVTCCGSVVGLITPEP